MADGKKGFTFKEFFLADIPAAVAASIGVPALLRAFREGFLEKKSKEAGEKAYDKFFADRIRAKLMLFIRNLAKENPTASSNLFKRQEDRQFLRARSYGNEAPYEPGDEDFMVAMLGKIFMAFEDNGEQKLEVFEWLGMLNDEDFDSALEFIHHDAFLQFLRKGWSYIKVAWSKLYNTDQNNPGFIQQADPVVAGHINNFRNILKSRRILR